jgi:hypothetical protein
MVGVTNTTDFDFMPTYARASDGSMIVCLLFGFYQ